MGAQKNRLSKSTQNTWLNKWVRKNLQFYAQNFCLSSARNAVKATSKCSIIFLLCYNQDGDVKGKQDNARNNDGPYFIYFKPTWYRKNYLLRHKQFRQTHFFSKIHDKHRFGDCMQNVFNDSYTSACFFFILVPWAGLQCVRCFLVIITFSWR